jgi:hypothetical protein
MPDGLASQLDRAIWILEGDDRGWIVGDYDGHSATVDLSSLATFSDKGRWLTAVEPVGAKWEIYDVAPNGDTTLLATLPAMQPSVLATRSPDGGRIFLQNGASGFDGGILSIDVASGKVDQLVQPRATEGESRRLLFWSADQETLFSSLCALYVCEMDVIDSDTAVVRRLPKPFGGVAGSDHYLLGYSSAEGPARPWEIYDLSTDKKSTVATKWITETDEGISIGADHFAVAGWNGDHSEYNIVDVDASTGESRLVMSQSADEGLHRLRRYMTGSKWVILGGDDLTAELQSGARSDVLDIDSGQVYKSVASISR